MVFGPKNNRPYKLIGVSDELSPTKLTMNLHNLNYHQNGTGRDSYIYHNNGGYHNVVNMM